MNASFDLVKRGTLAMLRTFYVGAALAFAVPVYAQDPVDYQKVVATIRQGYSAVVEVRINQPAEPESADQVSTLALIILADPDRTVSVPIVENQIAQNDIWELVLFLAPLPSERRVESLSSLADNTATLNSGELIALADKLQVTTAPTGDANDQDIGIFTRDGEQLSTIEGGDDASISEIVDSFSEALASLAESQASADMDLAETVPLISDEMEGLSIAVVNAPAAVAARSRVSPALEPVNGLDSSTRLRRAVLEGVVQKIDASAYDQKRFLRTAEKRVNRGDIENAFRDAGLTDVRLDNSRSPANPNIMDVVRDTAQGVEILASGLEMKGNGGQWYFSGESIISLREQLSILSESDYENTIGQDIRWEEWSEVIEREDTARDPSVDPVVDPVVDPGKEPSEDPGGRSLGEGQ